MEKQELKVGILFSLTGTTSITERGQYQACLLAIKHINESGGINGKTLIPIVEDAASDPDITRQKAEKLIVTDQVTAIIGCYTAACRKSVIPVLEKYNNLLFYPTINEGGEMHPNIFYSNSTPNQQLLDFIPWLIRHVGKTFYLLGSDYIYPREINRFVRQLVEYHGGSVFGEQYVALGNQVFDKHFSEIRQMNPDIVFSTLVGDSTISYYQQHEKLGFQQPIASNVTAETEIKAIDPKGKTEFYSSFSYFSTIDRAENRKFITEFQRIYGTDIISSVMESAYNSMILLAEALKRVDTVSTKAIRNALSGLSIEAPQGKIMVDPINQHVWLNSRIGKVNESGQFHILWESDNPIKPIPLMEDALPSHPKDIIPVKNNEQFQTKKNQCQPLLSELKKNLSWLPFPFAYFDEEGVLIEIINGGSPAATSPLLNLRPGDTVNSTLLENSGISTAFREKTSAYTVTNESVRKSNNTYVVAGFPIVGSFDKRKGVLGVYMPKTSSESTEQLLESIKGIIHLSSKLVESQEKQHILNNALGEITDQQPGGLFIIKEGDIHFQNKKAVELWGNKQSMVQTVLQEISLDRSDREKGEERILRRKDKEESFEIKVQKKNLLTFIRFKSLPRQPYRFSLNERKNLTTYDLIGSSNLFLKTIELARSASKIQANTLILGESGTGKEMFARAIHNESARRNKPFVAVNCGAMSKELINSELFGYVEGAFTGAKKGGSPGKFEVANGGTLFLDEIGEMPLELQTTLLRVLQEKEVFRVGGHKPIPLDVRIIAATNKDLFQEIAFNGSFRSDLYYRLNVFTIELVPLRKRPEDIAHFSYHYLEDFNALTGNKKEFSNEALMLMQKYNWPGNIRELCNVIERAYYLAGNSSIIEQEHLPQEIAENVQAFKQEGSYSLHNIKSITDIKEKNYEHERQFYIQILMKHKGNITRTAKHLSISRTTLYQRLKEFQIEIRRVK
ncbi:transporter substrate-binding protein [Bacillus sp. FJAT-29937]|uniref:transporter substrate-binding protein n=1 Tax=Bacillus sp. FJAT-29937 TaxID=1720553 RepID=UPI00082EA2DF|nr:transporter substrate-binding protein [Bacillus sp. FJAT-29937]